MSSGSPMRIVVVGVVALAIGLVAGGLGPRAELRSLRAQAQGEPVKCEGSGVGRSIVSAFRGRPWEAAMEDEAPTPAPAPAPAAGVPEETLEEGIQFNFNTGDGDDLDIESVEEGMDMARAAISLRRTQARAALEEGAAPDDAQWASIDAAIDDMNTELNGLAREFVDGIGAGQEPTRREAMLFAADTLDVILEADDRIYDSLDEDQRAAVEEEALDPLSHVDPALVDIFLELDR